MTLQIKIVDCETGEEMIRDMTKDELAQVEIDKKEALAQNKEMEAKAAARQAILDRLGLTEEEARLLLGGN